jgi:putative ABC transport system permease protein
MPFPTAPLRQLTRRLLRTPLFTAVTILTLGVGIGANTAIFSVVYGVLLKPLPFSEPERLAAVWHTAPGLNLPLLNMSPATYFTYRELGQVFEDIGIWDTWSVTVTRKGGEPERIRVLAMTDGTLPVLRVPAQLGRVFSKEDCAPGTPQRAILTHGYWQRKLGGAHDVVGRNLEIDGRPVEIIGVLPASFRFLQADPAILLPLQFNRAEVFFGNFSFQAVARLRPGITLAQANADVGRLIPASADRFPMPPGFTRKMLDDVKMGPNVRPLSADVIGDVGQLLWILLGTVGFVLLIACANVANLFLVRAEGRQSELALRAALGAGRGRLARGLLGESLTLGLVAGAFGVGLAAAGLQLLVWLAPSGLPRLEEIGLDPIVLLFTLVIAVVASVLFGLIPILRFGTPSVAALKEGGRSASEGPTRHRVRNVLVVAEIALALVLLIVSGLMIRTFMALSRVEPGFVRPEAVQTFRVAVPEALAKEPDQSVRVHQQIVERLRAVPGVERVGLSSSITMDGNNGNDPIFVEDKPSPEGQIPPLRRFKFVGPDYFETVGRRLVAGRAIGWSDSYQGAPVVVVSENFAREFWKDPAKAVGRRIRQSPKNQWREIVGVVADERDDGLHRPAPAVIYWPMLVRDFWDQAVNVQRTMGYVVRSERLGSPSFMQELQRAVWSVNPSLPLANARTLEEIRSRSMAQTSFALTMLALAASVALLLGVVGIYGVIAYIAAQRTREIGIRMALGAEAGHVSGLFLRHGLTLTAIGLALGIAASFGLTRFMSTLLFGVTATDAPTYAAVSAILGGVAVLATWLPARRASRVDPIAALRADG